MLKESAEWLAAEDPAPIAAREVQRARRRPRPSPRGTLRAVLDAQAVSDETSLRRVSEEPLRLVDDDDTVVLERPGRRLHGPAALRPALEVVVERDELRVADLSGLDEASRAVLARRLLRDGFLELDTD